MRRILFAVLLSLLSLPAFAQSNVIVNYRASSTGFPATQVSPTNPMPVTAGSGGLGSVTQGTVPWVDSVTTWGGGTLGAMANYGTSPGAVLVPGVNAFITGDPTQAPVAPATATATKAALTGCQYNSAGVAPTDGQQLASQCDQNGRLFVGDGSAAQVSSTPTVQNAQYVSGNCVGGFNAVTIATYNGQSGYVINARVASVAGGTETVTIYLFSANPSASTCTDKSTFTLNTADISKIIANPVNTAVTLSAPTGATPSFGSAEFTPPRPFQAGGSAASGVKTIYYAIVAGSTFTPGTTSDIQVSIGAALQ